MNYSNNAYSVIDGALTAATTSIQLAAGTGSRFPASDFRATLVGYDALGNENAWEIVHCSTRYGDVLTVVRGQEGTAAVAWANAARIENRLTAGAVSALEPGIAAGATSQYFRGDKSWRDFFADVRAATLAGLSTATDAAIAVEDTVLSAFGKLQAQLASKFDKAGGDVTGNANFRAGVQEQPVVANTGTAYTINLSLGSVFDLTMTDNCAYTFPAATAGKQFTLLQKQDATGARAVTWPSNVRWAKGTAPTPTTTAGSTDAFSFLADGTYWIGFVGGQDFNRA